MRTVQQQTMTGGYLEKCANIIAIIISLTAFLQNRARNEELTKFI